MRIAGAIALGALAAAASVSCKSESAPRPEPADEPAEAKNAADERPAGECDGECLQVPEGIVGTVFGLDRGALEKTFGRLRKKKMAARKVVAGPDCSEKVAPPGSLYTLKTELGGEKARCSLLVLEEGGLAGIACELAARREAQEHAEVTWALYQSLAKQYGSGDLDNEVVHNGRLTASWSSDRAGLELRAARSGAHSLIQLENDSKAYAEALAGEKAAIAARCAARDAQAAATRDDRIRRLREKRDQFEKDLRPPLERPKDTE